MDLDFDLLTVDGEIYHANRLIGRPTILVLLRYLGWLYCQEHLAQLRELDPEIATLQGRVVVISFARPEHVKRFSDHLGHPFLWLADPERLSYRQFGLGRRGLMAIAPPRVVWRHLRFALAGKIWHPEQLDVAQMGGDFVFDRRGRMTLEYLSRSSDDRPSVQTVMRAFRDAANAPNDGS